MLIALHIEAYLTRSFALLLLLLTLTLLGQRVSTQNSTKNKIGLNCTCGWLVIKVAFQIAFTMLILSDCVCMCLRVCHWNIWHTRIFQLHSVTNGISLLFVRIMEFLVNNGFVEKCKYCAPHLNNLTK